MKRINEVTKECFNALIQLRELDSSAASPDVVHRALLGIMERMRHQARAARYEDHEVFDITYALVALIDEVALDKGGAIRDFWMQRPLQLHYFHENLAGEGFFRRLDVLLSRPGRGDVLQVHYTCLLLGFRGQYAIRGGELQLDAIIQRVRRALAEQLEERSLSVEPNRPREADGRREGLPIVGVAMLFLLFSLGLLVALRLGLDRQTAGVVHQLEPLGKAEKPRGGN